MFSIRLSDTEITVLIRALDSFISSVGNSSDDLNPDIEETLDTAWELRAVLDNRI